MNGFMIVILAMIFGYILERLILGNVSDPVFICALSYVAGCVVANSLWILHTICQFQRYKTELIQLIEKEKGPWE